MKLINTEIKVHRNPGCESCSVEKQLQATIQRTRLPCMYSS